MSGVDLVLELPVLFSCHNAGVFADAAVDLLAGTGLVTDLAFGVEGPLEDANTISDILIQEPQSFKERLRECLAEGFSFVEARARALDSLVPGAGATVSRPNNSLALAYIRRIRERGYDMTPCPIMRTGAGYHEEGHMEIMSATGIRKAVERGGTDAVRHALEPGVFSLLQERVGEGRAVFSTEAYWKLARAVLIREPAERLKRLAEMGEGIEMRLKAAALRSRDWAEFLDRTTSRRYTRGRIQRHVAHILVGLDHWTNRAAQRLGPPYIRVLGATERGRVLLREMRQTATCPVVTRSSGTPGASRHGPLGGTCTGHALQERG
jgi:predicted nucleotidyltransferase